MKGEKEDTSVFRKMKSYCVLKHMFTFLLEEKKLELVKYNKKLQNRLLINIKDYENATDRYIIFEENGKGKEYIIKKEKKNLK